MDLALLGTQLPAGCQTATHADGQIEVYRDYANGNRYSAMFDPSSDETDVAKTVFTALYTYKYGSPEAYTDAIARDLTPAFSAGAVIDI